MKKGIIIASALVLTGGILFAQEQVQRKAAENRTARVAAEVKAEKQVGNLDNTVELSQDQMATIKAKLENNVTASEATKEVLNDNQKAKLQTADQAKISEMKARPNRGDLKSAPGSK